MSSGPDWQDGECCFRCRTQFTLVARKHHCRNCGNIFCAKCSSQQIPLPKLSMDKAVRVCDGCYEKIIKEEDSLALAMDTSKKSDQASSSTVLSTSTSRRGNSSSDSLKPTKGLTPNKPASDASAPSEQELKEEEDLQLALALSLSETTSKISFPSGNELKQYIAESTQKPQVSPSGPKDKPINKISDDTIKVSANQHMQAMSNDIDPTVTVNQQQQAQKISVVDEITDTAKMPISDIDDNELFKFVSHATSTAEIFINRLNSSKLRNRPVATDSSMQSLFMKVTDLHSRLLELIEKHEKERAKVEALQDKVTQITDARAALDALREEHREKLLQQEAEAERLRQSQLAAKLEMMRKKKAEMMQHQKELALQRIQEKEMAQKFNFAAEGGQQLASPSNKQLTLPSQPQPQVQTSTPEQQQLQDQTDSHSELQIQQQQQQQQVPPPEQQLLPAPQVTTLPPQPIVVEEEALISFDD